MKYNGKELREANGADYEIRPTSKRMLVWDDGECTPCERDVIGFFKGFWVAADSCGKGVCQWHHAAEIPKKPTLADYVQELHQATGRFPFVVHPASRPMSNEEICDAVDVSELNVLLCIHYLANPLNTFVVLPGCREVIKSMFRALAVHNSEDNPHAVVMFIKDEVA